MGGFFGVASRKDCTLELFYGVDYHSHLGTRRGGMATYGANGFSRAIHNIENSPFRTKFERDVEEMEGNLGIGCISDYEPQPLLIQSHLGSFAITTVGKINNMDQLLKEVYGNGRTHFQEMSTGQINATELAASLICSEKTIPEGIRHLQDVVNGSMTLLLLTKDGIYAARDKKGRTPLVIGKKEGAYCASFENFAYLNLGYTDYHELGPGEIDFITPESVEMLVPPQEEMKICSFLWVYYGYRPRPTRELMSRRCGITAVPCLPNVMREAMSTRISLQVCRIPELPMQSAMRMSPKFRLQDHSSNIPRPGHAPLCRPTRNREI